MTYLAARIAEALTLTLVCLLAFFGNLSLWFVIFNTRSLRETSYYIVLVLSVADIFVSAVSMPITIYTIIEGDWRFSEVTCIIIGFINMSTFIASVMSLGTISLNRYVKICHSHYYQRIYSVRNVVYMTAGVWCISFLLAMPPLIGWGRYRFLPNQSFCFCDWKMSVSYTIFMITVCFGGPCFTMTFCYYKILKTFRNSSSRLFGGSRAIFAKPRCFGKKVSPDSSVKSIAYAETSQVKATEQMSSSFLQEPQAFLTHSSQSSTTVNVTAQTKTEPLTPIQGTQLSQITVSSGSHEENSKQQRRVSSAAPPVQMAQRRRMTVTMNTQSDDNSHIQFERRQARRRNEEFVLSAALLLVIFVFIICWLPFCIAMFITVFSPNEVAREADMFALLLGYINSCCNPVIYGFLNKRFNAGYKMFFRKMCSCCKRCTASVDVDPISTAC
ncbi:melatonin-related receptor-like [Gigantopelta aegis]|uniref:melatonin-related receptor-like n=1 Tax=Gigantopelta aegis TaxID=1735272 RepID=UPI001B8894D3|nr:melatonin-related receptor-like [Gigantopelta aegis]